MLQKHPLSDWIIHLRKTFSTMQEAENLLDAGKPLPDSILIVADEQQGGIGRNNNQWVSPPGGLWFTYLVKSQDNHPQISLLLGLCLLRNILNHYPSLKNDLRIKWPNDLLYKGKKLAGILVKSRSNYLCVGIGINTNVQTFPYNMNLLPTSLENELAFPISNTSLLATFLVDFRREYDVYQKEGLLTYISAINSCLYGINTRIAFDKGMETSLGICLGVNEDGALLLENAMGHITQNYSGSIIRFGV